MVVVLRLAAKRNPKFSTVPKNLKTRGTCRRNKYVYVLVLGSGFFEGYVPWSLSHVVHGKPSHETRYPVEHSCLLPNLYVLVATDGRRIPCRKESCPCSVMSDTG